MFELGFSPFFFGGGGGGGMAAWNIMLSLGLGAHDCCLCFHACCGFLHSLRSD